MTATGPDLEGARLAIEALMDDVATVTRQGRATGALDPITLQPLPGPLTTLYANGPCTISIDNAQPQEVTTGGVNRVILNYAVRFPVNECPELKSGDLITVTYSRRDPLLPGKVLIIDTLVYKSMAISRKVIAQLETATL